MLLYSAVGTKRKSLCDGVLRMGARELQWTHTSVCSSKHVLYLSSLSTSNPQCLSARFERKLLQHQPWEVFAQCSEYNPFIHKMTSHL